MNEELSLALYNKDFLIASCLHVGVAALNFICVMLY